MTIGDWRIKRCPSCSRDSKIIETDAPVVKDCPSPSTEDHPPHLWQEGLGEFAHVHQCPGKRSWDNESAGGS